MPLQIDLPMKEIEQMYWEEGTNTWDIGKRFGVTHQCVLSNMRRYGISRRNCSESRQLSIRDSINKLDFAYLLGVRYGDGYLSPNWSFVLNTIEKEFAEHVKKKLDLVALSKLNILNERTCAGNKVYRVSLHRKKFWEMLDNLSFSSLSNNDERIMFVNGFMDSEGCVFLKKNPHSKEGWKRGWGRSLTASNTNIELLNELSCFFNSVGIGHSLLEHKQKKRGWSDYKTIQIASLESLKLYHSIFRFINPEKQAKLDFIAGMKLFGRGYKYESS